MKDQILIAYLLWLEALTQLAESRLARLEAIEREMWANE